MFAALLQAGCTAQSAWSPMAEARLVFGDGDNPAFTDFLDRSVTPRFPPGSRY